MQESSVPRAWTVNGEPHRRFAGLLFFDRDVSRLIACHTATFGQDSEKVSKNAHAGPLLWRLRALEHVRVLIAASCCACHWFPQGALPMTTPVGERLRRFTIGASNRAGVDNGWLRLDTADKPDCLRAASSLGSVYVRFRATPEWAVTWETDHGTCRM
jgi:hypothetical protein